MGTQLHGISSLGLMLAAIVLAAVVMFQISCSLGTVYCLVSAAALLAILYAYCAKCPSGMDCGHFFPGRVAKVFKRQASGPYTAVELAVTGFSLLLLIGLPQVWLWRHTGPFVAFWVMIGTALIQIRTTVCRRCNNIHCPAKPS